MNFDDKLRDAFERSAPRAPDAPRVRGALGPAMTRARRTHRIRRGVAAATLTLGLVGGGAAAAVQLSGGADNEVDTRTSTLPPPETTTATPDDGIDAPSTTATPDGEGSAVTTPTPSTPSTTAPPAATTSLPSTPLPTTSPPTSSAPTPTTTTEPRSATLSGPHSTPCGTVTFVVTSTVAVDSHTLEPGYVFSTEGEGSTEVEAKWSLGPDDECQVEAHFEDDELFVHFDEE